MKKRLLVIFLAALAVRALAVSRRPFNAGVGSDFGGIGPVNLEVAYGLLRTGGFVELESVGGKPFTGYVIRHTPLEEMAGLPIKTTTSTSRMPLYPLIAAAIMRVRSDLDPRTLQWAQIVADAVSAVLIASLAFSLMGPFAGWFAGLFYALWPPYIHFSSIIHDGAFSMFLNAVILCAAMPLLRERLSDSRCALIGGLVGVATLFRSDAVWLLAYFFVAFSCLYRESNARRARQFCLLLGGAILAISPWTTRNYFFYKRLVPTTTLYPGALWEGLGDFPKFFKEYSHLNNDANICSFAASEGFRGPCVGWNDKATQIQLLDFLRGQFRQKILFEHPAKYGAFLAVKWARYFFAHRFLMVSGNCLGLPVGGSRDIAPALIVDLALVPFLLLLMPFLFSKSRLFWLLYLFHAVSACVHVLSASNETRYFVASTIAFPLLFAMLALKGLTAFRGEERREGKND